MIRKCLSSMLFSAALLTTLVAIPGLTGTALACPSNDTDCNPIPRSISACKLDVDCLQTPDNGPVFACDDDSGRGCD